MTDQTITLLPLDAIVASTTNPRKHFDAAKLAELAESIKASGVHQPILARPLPGARVPDTNPGTTHEIVAGERRYRASQLAGVRTIPAWVRELTDAQVLEIQLVENLMRDDLTELEEADGYDHLMRTTGISRAALAAKIGKSPSYINARMKLLDLGAEGRAALAEGKLDASRALLIARIPSTELQAKATRAITDGGYYGQSMSYRAAADYVQREYMLKLHDAKFSKADADLVPDAGPCKACPKRTGANPDLFSDVKGADVCTDPPCYRAKEAAHLARERAEAEARGITIIDGKEARALIPNSWSNRVEGHLRLDDKADSPTDKPLRNVLKAVLARGEVQPVYVANPHKGGELVAVLPAAQVAELLREQGHASAADDVAEEAQERTERDEKEAKRKAQEKLEAAWRWQVLEEVWPAAQDRLPPLADGVNSVLRLAAMDYAERLRVDEAKALAKLLDLGKVAPKDGVQQWVKDAPSPLAALALLVARTGVAWQPWAMEHRGEDDSLPLWTVADALEVDRKAIEREARAEAKRAAAGRKKAENPPDTPAPTAPAAQADRVRGRGKPKTDRPAARAGGTRKAAAPKVSEQEARAGIAAAMQSDDAPAVLRPPASVAMEGAAADADAGATAAIGLVIGTRVRVNALATGKLEKKFVGRTGTIVAPAGANCWDVELPTGRKGSGMSERKAFLAEELEVLA